MEILTNTDQPPAREKRKYTHRWPECPLCDVPALLEESKVSEGDARCLRSDCEDSEDGRIDVVFVEAANGNEGIEIVFIGDVAVCAGECVSVVGSGDAYFPCQATTSKGVCSCLHVNSWPPSLCA